MLCDVGHFIATHSHSVNVSCWSALRVSSVYHIVISCPLLSLWSLLQVKSIVLSLLLLWSIICHFQLNFGLSLQAWRVRWSRLLIFLLVLLLLCRSCILNWVPFSNFHHVSLTRQRCDSQRQPPFHSFVGFEPTSSICILIFERASSVRPFFFFNRCYVNLFVNIILDREITVFIIARVWTLSILIFLSSVLPKFSVSSFSLVLSVRFSIFLYFFFVCMMKRSILRCVALNHSFMLFCMGPSSRCVIHRGWYHCVEKPKSVSQHASFRCQLLSIFVECCPRSFDAIPVFCRLLLMKNNHLAKILFFFSYKHLDVDVVNFNFSSVRALVAEDFRLSFMYSESHFSVLRLKSQNMFWSCSLEWANSSTSSAKISYLWGNHYRCLRSRYPFLFSFCQRGMSSYNAFCRIVLKSKLDNGSLCLVSFSISNMSLSLSVNIVAFWSLNSFSGNGCIHVRYRKIWGCHKFHLWVMESNAFMMSIGAAHIFPSTRGIFDQSSCTSLDVLLLGKSFWTRLICRVDSVKSGKQSAVQHCRR